MISLKIGGFIVAAFMAGAFFASPLPEAIASTIANDVICSGCVGTTDLAGNAVTAAKIKDGEVKAAEIAANAVGSSEIATNAVGASELQGVTKLVFTACSITINVEFGGSVIYNTFCPVSGVTTSDRVIVTKEFGNPCFTLANAEPNTDGVIIRAINACNGNELIGTQTFSVIVYRPG